MREIPTIDFETHAIKGAPAFNPPEPVGVAVRLPQLGSVYLAWGHPTGNNCTKQDAHNLLERVWDEHLGQNCTRFDVCVGMKHFGLPRPRRMEDTLYQLFLNEPLAPTLSLKPSAERLLKWPPDEANRLEEWIKAHIPGINKDTNPWGAYIAEAPAELVGPYAIGDVDRTWALHEYLTPQIEAQGMVEAYERELRLAPILNANEMEGIYVDLPRLEKDLIIYEAAYERVQHELIKLLKCSPDLNFNSGPQLAEAIQRSGKCDLSKWVKTPTGKLSTARENLHVAITDPRLYMLLAYRGPLHTCLTTFMRPWLAQARACGGRVHPQWNAVRGDFGGTRTGRLSSYAPNFQNIPTEFEEAVPEGYPPLPLMRSYVLPRPGEVFISADFHSQEVRVLGHFAEGPIKAIYDADPAADIHQTCSELIKDATGVVMDRKQVKIIAFTIIYGGGVSKIAAGLGVDWDTARRFRRAYLDTIQVEGLMDDVTSKGDSGQTIRSWGGRILRAPSGRGYALVNYLIQGSASDQTKEAVCTLDHFYIQVHDEICDSAPKKELKHAVAGLRHAMETMEGWDVPMRAEVKVGPNWANLKEYK